MNGKVIMFWSRKRGEICFINELHSGILFTTGAKKKLTKKLLQTCTIKNFTRLPFFYSHNQHKAAFKGDNTGKLVESIARSKKDLRYWEIEL